MVQGAHGHSSTQLAGPHAAQGGKLPVIDTRELMLPGLCNGQHPLRQELIRLRTSLDSGSCGPP